jgi:hypothetical protein
MKMAVEKTAQVGRAVGGMGNHFHAIAGGNNHGLFNAGLGAEFAAGLGQPGFGKGEALTDFEGSAVVIDADELISHAANL